MNPLLPVLTACLLALAASQNCAPSLANDQLLTGTYTFSINGQRLQCYNVSLNAASSGQLQLAYSISNILNYQVDTAGVDFSLRGRVEPHLLSFSLILNNASYAALSVAYLITARPDLLAGSYIADTNQLLGCNAQQNALIAFPVTAPAAMASSKSVTTMVFVNGIRTQAFLFNLKFLQPVLDVGRGQVNVTILSDALYPIETLFLSYLIMDLASIAKTYTYSFPPTPQTSDFSLSGLVAFSNFTSTQLQFAYLSLTKTLKLTCAGNAISCNQCTSTTACIASGATVSGSLCTKCLPNQVYLTGSGCVCANGFSLINGSCGTCPANAVYVAKSQSCLACGQNAAPANGACICASGFFNISGSCQTCPAGAVYSALLQSCSSVCSGGQQWLNGACSCPTNTYLISGTCGTCPLGFAYSAGTASCSQLCTLPNQIYSNGQCTCAQGYTLSSSACVLASSLSISTPTTTATTTSCGANQYILNGACKCYSAYIQYQGKCYSCPDNAAVTADQAGCICNPGFSLTPSYTCAPTSYASTTAGTSSSSSSSSSQTGSTTATGTTATGTTTGITTTSSISTTTSSSSPSSSFSSQSCPIGTYFDGFFCQACSSYCVSCFTSSICISCSSGFNISQSFTAGVFSSNCNEVCGDGRRFTLPCDDGNSVGGDGCSSTCSVQSGWACSGGSASSKDTCAASASASSRIILLRNVVFGNALYQNVLLSPLPAALAANGCPSCPFLLNATLGTAPPNASVDASFIPGTQYQYVLTAIIPNTGISSGVLVLNVRLNSTFAAYFSAADMAQQQTLTLNLSSVPVITPQITAVTYSVSSDDDSLEGSGEKSAKSAGIAEILKFLNNQ